MNWNQLFDYRDGQLFYKYPAGNNPKRIGTPAGLVDKQGYVRVKVFTKKYAAQNIIWEMHNGSVPPGFTVDHGDRVRNNNRIENLQLATKTEQNLNKGKMKLRAGGAKYKGVAKGKRPGKWRLFFMGTYLGQFDNQEDPATVYNFLAYEKFGDKVVLNTVFQPFLDSYDPAFSLAAIP